MSTNWWMYHGNSSHTGEVTGSTICRDNVSQLRVRDVPIPGPILSVPALVDGKIYVGLANRSGMGVNGGLFLKIDPTSGRIEAEFSWKVPAGEGDSHGFMGMGCTPAVSGGKIYFFAFNCKLYCLDQKTLKPLWVTDLRRPDRRHGQPISNTSKPAGKPAAGWSSPVVANGRVYVGTGEGENPALFGLVFCIDANTGDVDWIYCTVQLVTGTPNKANQIPRCVVPGSAPAKFTLDPNQPLERGCSVWSSIAYDESLNRIFCATGNPSNDHPLPTPGFSNGILALDASTGQYQGFFQAPCESSYRCSDKDIDFGGSPMLYTLDGRRVVVAGCKNGGFFLLDAESVKLLNWRQLLPHYNDGGQIATVDPHLSNRGINAFPSNEDSNRLVQENFHGTYSTPAVHSGLGRLFIGVGGKNYADIAPGIDSPTTPFMRALDWKTLEDAWPMSDGNPRRYTKAHPPMYSVSGEAGLSSPVVVNDVVFCSTSRIALYAFDAHDGTCLWMDRLGDQTGGLSGGYGFCLGPAIESDFVVAGGLVFGRNGGVLRIYSL